MPEKGLKYVARTTVGADNTALAMGSGDMEVFATPAMVALMEHAAMYAVAADGHEQPDVVIDEKTEVEPFGKVLVAGPVTAHVEVRPAAGENLVGQAVVYVQHFGFSGKEPFVTVVKPYHTVSVSQKGLRDAADNGIHARCRATPGKYGYGIFHCTAYLLQVRSI